MQLFTYEIMSEIIGLTHAKDCDAYSQQYVGILVNRFYILNHM